MTRALPVQARVLGEMREEGRQRRVRVLLEGGGVSAGGVEGENVPEHVVEHRGTGGLGQFVHVLVVVVERGAAHVGPVGDVGDADLRKVPLPDQTDEGALQGRLGAPHAPVARQGAAALPGHRHGPEPTFSCMRTDTCIQRFSIISC